MELLRYSIVILTNINFRPSFNILRDKAGHGWPVVRLNGGCCITTTAVSSFVQNHTSRCALFDNAGMSGASELGNKIFTPYHANDRLRADLTETFKAQSDFALVFLQLFSFFNSATSIFSCIAKMSETDPLLSRSSSQVSENAVEKKRAWAIKLLPTFTTISPKYRWVPFLGCALIFINEAEYFVKQVATMRAIESMYCYNYYLARGSDLVELGKHIPERLCKDDSIQKDLARTAGLIMFVRMLSAMIGALPLGYVADRVGRKFVIVMHKVNVVVSCSAWLAFCKKALGLDSVPC